MPAVTPGRPAIRSTKYVAQLYYVFNQMHRRCNDPLHKQYRDYGGRGIYVRSEWRTFWAFYDCMHPRPIGGLLDRVDNDGPYSPGNCRWATRVEQNSNRRNCRYVDLSGEQVTLKEYCRRASIPYRATLKRLFRGWPLNRALQWQDSNVA